MSRLTDKEIEEALRRSALREQKEYDEAHRERHLSIMRGAFDRVMVDLTAEATHKALSAVRAPRLVGGIGAVIRNLAGIFVVPTFTPAFRSDKSDSVAGEQSTNVSQTDVPAPIRVACEHGSGEAQIRVVLGSQVDNSSELNPLVRVNGIERKVTLIDPHEDSIDVYIEGDVGDNVVQAVAEITEAQTVVIELVIE